MFEINVVTSERVADVERLFASDPVTNSCFCMWFIIPVRDYHAGGHRENRRRFLELVNSETTPVGLVAYRDGEPVGWCATGPRSRYVRAARTPTLRGSRDKSEDDEVWLVPCFYIRPDARRSAISRALLDAAVDLARAKGATAVEGFPFAQRAKAARESMVGWEQTFSSCEFTAIDRPSATRVVMRRNLKIS